MAAILTGAILQLFQRPIFTPAPYVFHTPPILKNFISHPLPLSSLHSFIPATLPYRIPNPHPSQSKNNAISPQITTSIYQAKNKSKPQHNKKTLSNWLKSSYWLTQNNSKLVQSILPKLLTILAARPLPLLSCNTQIAPKQCSSTP